MSRGWGVIEFLREVLPGWAPEAFVYVTQLGDAWFLFVLLSLLYWFGDDRERWGFVLGATLGALALTLLLKGLFGLPRPRAALQFVHASGYGFPSGHAIGSTVVWGLLALSIERSHHHVRVAVAATVVALVALSRLVIGVHFAVDVIVGVLVGLAYLAVVVRGLDWRPRPTFALAAGIAFAAMVVAVLVAPRNWTVDSVAAFGGTTGALVAWFAMDHPLNDRVGPAAAVVGLLLLGALSYVGLRLSVPLSAVFVINAVSQGGILAYPRVVGRVGGRRVDS
ncbi:phosphatase PAP2 family protein [Haladaptatus salinisoli]|uniref:phosphatase PAP2 family protein n=1 Tax=Haladaptatus salinisoli TaxID=2884876 RepID=UPI001D09CF88|nr:phosphatase PAP2 family protein [Haladaptatus salinisoli]